VDSAAGNNRPYRIESWLTGAGSIEWHDFNASLDSTGGLNINGTSNTFSGTWHVVQGVLLGSGANSLGTNSITVDATGALETLYNLNSPTANLVLNGQMFLHSADTFQTVTIGNYLLPAGTNTYAQLAASFPGNFPGSWNLQIGSAVNTASGSITVLAGSTINPITLSFATVGTNLISSGSGGIPYGGYYVLSSTNIALPKASWTRSAVMPFDNLGNFSFTNGITSNPRQQFFQLQQRIP
jgi:hypothetical protein